ncbi:3-oxoacyl-ACP reductase [Tsukamurella sp. 8F]|uniref:3-oxoacyl-ACP reductase n=1 Tax=unclassified Tsukamurella TaxID=2633480 RepID=UPI0023BA304C|nr:MULTISPECIES: 3-oxoacyl-ACP reductase [unclassified Tsukamurella]MDF0530738.1 3-oxoacyl-ACP reductase [Tsukamurella sp. 8J]MDF0587939.1 3-oxoacyl-ACP reductase [Tsukamurella sp. 8F]
MVENRVAVVTGAGAGLGRAEALALAARGAAVVVSDVSASAHDVADEIAASGGTASAVVADVAERAGADAMLAAARKLGGLHIVVNNAGFCRDRMLFSMTDDDWDDVIRVHLRGHFLLSQAATAHWRTESKLAGEPVYGRLINTASEAFLFGSVGQPNYAAAKAGIAALTVAAARGCGRYGVTANAICPRARTAMTEAVFGQFDGGGIDPLSPEHVARFVAFLASPAAADINGQVFVVHGSMVALMAPPTVEQRFDADGTWTDDSLATSVGAYFAGRDPARMFAAREIRT